MMARITIQVGDEQFSAQLSPEASPQTVEQILAALPIESVARQWGDEIYFEIPVDTGEEDAQATVSKGDLGYWPAGNCFCIFYGKTPMSRSEEEIVPASPVNVIGNIDDPEGLKKHAAGEPVVIELAE
ncbi:MAG: cyclophilin-like fold protein [Planctomycetota bacterium]|jgi:hypothetical protein